MVNNLEGYAEYAVQKKLKAKDRMPVVASAALMVVGLAIWTFIAGWVGPSILIIGIALTIITATRQELEYEYIFVNGDCEISKIVKRSSRKKVYEFEAVYMQRIAQLTNKSNQFNLTTLRCTEDDIRSMAEKPDWITLYGKLVDKFADNGVVTVVAGQAQGQTLCLRLWLMSCRVLKRGMEDAMMDTLAAKAAAAGYTALEGYYYPTAKNAMVREFYAGYGFEKTAEDADGNTTWRLDLAAYNPRCPHIKIET